MLLRDRNGRVRRWAASALALAAVVGVLSGVSAASAPASFADSVSTAYGLITGYEGNCLDLAGDNESNFNGVDLWPCWAGDPAQVWTWQVDSSGTQTWGPIYLLQSFLQGSVAGGVTLYCLGTVGGAQTNGTPVDIYLCNGTQAENWGWDPATGEIHNAVSGKCLDDTNWQPQGVQLQIWDCTGNANQQWDFHLSGILPA